MTNAAMTDKQAPESRGTEVSDEELRSIIVRACNINAIDVTPAEMQFARDLARALLAPPAEKQGD